MIIDLKTNEGYVYAWCVYQIVNEEGKTDNNGIFVYIEDVWTHENHRGETLVELIAMILTDPYVDQCKYVYWEKRKQNWKLKTYKIERFLKGISYGEKQNARATKA